MKRFLKDQRLFFYIGLCFMAYILFLFRNRIWYALLIDGIVILPLLYVCRRLIALPFDKLMKPKTEEVVFNGKADTHELQFSREYFC